MTKNRNNSVGVRLGAKLNEVWKTFKAPKLKDYIAKNDTYKDEGKWTLKGDMLSGRCRSTQHAGKDLNPSLGIFPSKGFAKCFTCGYYERDIGKILAPIFNKDPKSVLKDIQSHFNVKILKAEDFKDSEAYTKHVLMKNLLAKVFNQELVTAIEFYRAGTLQDSELYYAENMIKYLEQRDTRYLDYAGNLPLGIFVSSAKLVSSAQSLGVHGTILENMKDYLHKYMVEYYMGALVMVSHECPNSVSRFRLRLPDSVNESGKSEKIIRAIPDAMTPDLGIFGLGNISGVLDVHDKNPVALLSEGEFDTLAVMVHQMEANDPSWIPICHSGNAAASSLSALESTPIETVYYVPDFDTGGVNNAKVVLQENHNLDIRLFSWPMGIQLPASPSTDLFDSIKAYGYSKVSAELKEKEKNYSKRETWSKNKVTVECRELDAGDTDDFNKIKEIAQDYATCVGDINDANTHDNVKKWLNDVLTNMGVSATEITSITVSASSHDDPEKSFLSLLAATLPNYFHFVAFEPIERNITVWDKRKRSVSTIRTASEAGMKTDIGNALGDLVSWVVAEVPGGVPSFIKFTDKDEKIPRSYLHIDGQIGDYIRMAIRFIIPELPSISAYEKYSDGVHWLNTTAGERLFVVNGNHVYMGYWKEGGLIWDELHTPVYEKFYFDLSKKRWSEYINSVKDLQNAPDKALSTIMEKNAALLNVGWTFTSQETEVAIMAAWATQSTVVKIFPTNMQFLASNERSCGKSALYAEFFGGGKGTEINITEHTQYVDNITPAGMRQAMDGSGRILIVDEFDNQKGSRGTQEKQEEVLTMLRTCSGGDGIFIQGTSSGLPREYRFSVSTMMSGIDPEMTEANQTRLMTTDLQSGLDGRLPPQASICAKYTQEEIKELRMWNTLCTFVHVPKIVSAHSELTKIMLESPDILGENVMQRFKESLIKILCVYKAAYPETDKWLRIGRAICDAKKAKLDTLNKATANADLIDTLLYTAGIEVVTPVDKKVFSLIQLISSSEIKGDQTPINNANAGVWLQPSNEIMDNGDSIVKYYLFIQWKNIVSTLFKYSSRWKQSPAQLKTIASRHPKVLKDSPAAKVYNKEKAIPGWIGGSSDNSFSVLDITKEVYESAEREAQAHEYSGSNEHINSIATKATKPVDVALVEDVDTKKAAGSFDAL